jgi:hypothetical protein
VDHGVGFAVHEDGFWVKELVHGSRSLVANYVVEFADRSAGFKKKGPMLQKPSL